MNPYMIDQYLNHINFILKLCTFVLVAAAQPQPLPCWLPTQMSTTLAFFMRLDISPFQTWRLISLVWLF